MSAINWSAIDWVSLVALSLLAARVGERLSFGSRGLAALVTALVFAAGFAVWSYALHDTVTQGIAMLASGKQG
jgi:lipopolysaccharide export LptBFGC system permease protein LptF